ncbi:hypothetical protein OE88DRAFT_1740378 [Heliocybe sulcata]|uniref:Uncharacterized protein n=1 Tax=Heliocybe sulcata TaxID=5364 RepID=A0A5C3MVC5_9AGAM|nr:hypothetical protein OE88DRAFT_1740378 [Heliocybe sulcata]
MNGRTLSDNSSGTHFGYTRIVAHDAQTEQALALLIPRPRKIRGDDGVWRGLSTGEEAGASREVDAATAEKFAEVGVLSADLSALDTRTAPSSPSQQHREHAPELVVSVVASVMDESGDVLGKRVCERQVPQELVVDDGGKRQVPVMLVTPEKSGGVS